jgi:hypothetical protein
MNLREVVRLHEQLISLSEDIEQIEKLVKLDTGHPDSLFTATDREALRRVLTAAVIHRDDLKRLYDDIEWGIEVPRAGYIADRIRDREESCPYPESTKVPDWNPYEHTLEERLKMYYDLTQGGMHKSDAWAHAFPTCALCGAPMEDNLYPIHCHSCGEALAESGT